MVELSGPVLLGDDPSSDSEEVKVGTDTQGIVIEIPGIKEETDWLQSYGRTSDKPDPEVSVASILGQQYNPKRIHALSTEKVLATRVQSKLIGAIHNCYDRHLPLALSPEVIWYTILHEIAIHSKKFPTECAHLFTMKPDEVQIVRVRDDSLRYDAPSNWGGAIQLFDDALRELVPEGSMETFLPKFSTSTKETDISMLVAFMDAASPYYAYRVSTLCGIPRIRLNGTPDDWMTLVRNTTILSERVPGLDSWFAELIPVLQKIHAAAEGERDLDFWQSIYKVSGGSGGPYVSGWITTLSAYTYTYKKEVVRKDSRYGDWKQMMTKGHGGFTTDVFLPHLSSVPFIWEYLGAEIPMTFVSGVVGLSKVDDFFTPSLGWAVLETGDGIQKRTEPELW